MAAAAANVLLCEEVGEQLDSVHAVGTIDGVVDAFDTHHYGVGRDHGAGQVLEASQMRIAQVLQDDLHLGSAPACRDVDEEVKHVGQRLFGPKGLDACQLLAAEGLSLGGVPEVEPPVGKLDPRAMTRTLGCCPWDQNCCHCDCWNVCLEEKGRRAEGGGRW
jgi:hypothetical protein